MGSKNKNREREDIPQILGKKRLFIAFSIPDKASRELSRCLSLVGEKSGIEIKAEPKHHLTLRFLGSVDADVPHESHKAGALASVLFVLAKSMDPIPVSLDSLGTFDGVLYCGVDGIGRHRRSLFSFNENLENTAIALGFRKSDYAFKPHITLGRWQSPVKKGDVDSAVYNLRHDLPGDTHFTLEKVSLFESIYVPANAGKPSSVSYEAVAGPFTLEDEVKA